MAATGAWDNAETTKLSGVRPAVSSRLVLGFEHVPWPMPVCEEIHRELVIGDPIVYHKHPSLEVECRRPLPDFNIPI